MKAKDGSLSGTWGSPDQGAKGLPLESLTYADGTLSFMAKTAKASYKGKMNEPGTEIAGEWSQGGAGFALNLKRIDPSKVVVVPIPAELEGIWEGKLQVNGGITLRLALNGREGKRRRLRATLASPDQGANNIPVSSIGLKDKTLTFESKVIGAKFTGKQNEKGTVFEGEFDQLGASCLSSSRKQIRSAHWSGRKLLKLRSRTAPRMSSTRTSPPSEAGGYADHSRGAGPFPAVLLITGSGGPRSRRDHSGAQAVPGPRRLPQPARSRRASG